MIDSWLKNHRTSLVSSIAIALYIKFLLLPTATFFFEAYHLVKVEVLYVGYQIFKVAGYAYSKSEAENTIAIAVALLVLGVSLLIKKLRSRKTTGQEVGQV